MTKVKRKIVYVLMAGQTFPAWHHNKGQQTYFPEKIMAGEKQQSVRGNYAAWKRKADKINAGLAVLSIRIWVGKPYGKGSTVQEIMELSSIGVQKVHVYHVPKTISGHGYDQNGKLQTHTQIFIDNKIIPLQHPFKFAAKDGLSMGDFNAWFKKPLEDGVVIHFNSHFKY